MFSNKKYYNVSTQHSLMSPVEVLFGRRNSFFTFYLDEYSDGSYGHSRLYLGLCTWLAAVNKGNKLFAIHAMYNGEEVPYSIRMDYAAIRIQSLFGYAEFCIAEEKLLRIRGEGITCMLTAELAGHESAKPRENGSFEVDMGMINQKFLFMPVCGSVKAEGVYNYRNFGVGSVRAEFVPEAEQKTFEGAVLHFQSNQKVRMEFEPYEVCVSNVKADFAEWCRKLPEVPARYQDAFAKAAYMVWSCVMKPREDTDTQMVYVDRSASAAAYAWQQSYHAVVHSKDIQFAWKLLLSIFQYQDEAGQLPDAVNDYYSVFQVCKPPLQGFVINWILNHCDLRSITAEQYEALYKPLGKWTDWWFTYRDRNQDGLPAYDHGDECGADDSTIFSKGIPLSSPDLASLLILQMDVLSRIADKLNKKQESREWKQRADTLLEKMLAAYWTGDHFIALQGENADNIVEAESLQLYVPLILGKRLPESVRNTLLHNIQREDKVLTPYGLSSEPLDSPRMDLSYAWSRGTINAPNQFMLTIALADCGADELASKVAKAYCDNISKYGPHQHFNPFTGEPADDFGFFRIHYSRWTSWAAGVFLVLAGYVQEK